MTGEPGIHGDICGLVVADFADQYHIRILTDDGTKSHSEGIIPTSRYLCLCNVGNFVFYRVFDSDDFCFGSVELAKYSVEGCGFAASCGAGIEDDASWLLEGALDLFVGETAESKYGDILQGSFLIEESHNETLAEVARYARYADVYFS